MTNTFPGFKGLEQASQVNVPEKIFTAMRQNLDAEFGQLSSEELEDIKSATGE